MNRPSVLVFAPQREIAAWEEALRSRGLEVKRPPTRKEAGSVPAREPPSVVVVSEKLPFGGALRATRELRKDPLTREAPVVLVGVRPITIAQRLRLGAAAPDATVDRGATPEAIATAAEEAMRRGRLPPVELTTAQKAGMRYSRIGTMLMVLGVIFSLPAGGSAGTQGRGWFILLIPLGGLLSDFATGRVDGRRRLLSWQGWTAIVLTILMAVGIAFWPDFFRFTMPRR
ncbi:MAG TPA: hypothetical protein VFG53_08075 [Anaeromyxobacter sp.]|nr:hypothetical protein [Anaeromyxobacter sp.]